ncbi:unnamed protein product [Amoebophrya sp. A25]|nr:unnamed protein product [Amoebophrya sp. A25]|eukprot:GSA25T00023720001.1
MARWKLPSRSATSGARRWFFFFVFFSFHEVVASNFDEDEKRVTLLLMDSAYIPVWPCWYSFYTTYKPPAGPFTGPTTFFSGGHQASSSSSKTNATAYTSRESENFLEHSHDVTAGDVDANRGLVDVPPRLVVVTLDENADAYLRAFRKKLRPETQARIGLRRAISVSAEGRRQYLNATSSSGAPSSASTPTAHQSKWHSGGKIYFPSDDDLGKPNHESLGPSEVSWFHDVSKKNFKENVASPGKEQNSKSLNAKSQKMKMLRALDDRRAAAVSDTDDHTRPNSDRTRRSSASHGHRSTTSETASAIEGSLLEVGLDGTWPKPSYMYAFYPSILHLMRRGYTVLHVDADAFFRGDAWRQLFDHPAVQDVDIVAPSADCPGPPILQSEEQNKDSHSAILIEKTISHLHINRIISTTKRTATAVGILRIRYSPKMLRFLEMIQDKHFEGHHGIPEDQRAMNTELRVLGCRKEGLRSRSGSAAGFIGTAEVSPEPDHDERKAARPQSLSEDGEGEDPAYEIVRCGGGSNYVNSPKVEEELDALNSSKEQQEHQVVDAADFNEEISAAFVRSGVSLGQVPDKADKVTLVAHGRAVNFIERICEDPTYRALVPPGT